MTDLPAPGLWEADGTAWVDLGLDPYRTYWARFDAMFDWHGGMDPQDWVGAGETAPSVTFDLAGLTPGACLAASREAINAEAVRAFVALLPPSEPMIVLDYQHPSYEFRPSEHALMEPQHWPVTVYPDGDYYAFLAPDFSFGTFGHPWEQTLCVFGEALIATLGATLRTWLPVKREQHAPAADEPGPAERT